MPHTPALPAPPAHQLGWDFLRLAAPYWSCERKWKVRAAVFLLVLLTLAQVVLAIWISFWNRELFDALEARSTGALLREILTFALIFALTIVVTAAHLHAKRWVQLDWRQWLTSRLLDQWMERARHYRLQFVHGEHDNPDGRIAEDIRIATEMAVALAHSLLYSVLIFGSFVDILLSVSGSVTLPGTSVAIPGYMVLLAFLYAGAGSLLGFILGRPLINTTNRLQTVEANLRFNLAQAREHSEAIALMHGEGLERRSAARLFVDICRGWNRQTLAYLGIVSFSAGYGTLLPVFPILVAAPQYIAGTMTLGILMQAAQAFQRLTSALSWPIDNLGDLAKCRASAERVISLYNDMLDLETSDLRAAAQHVHIARSTSPDLEIRKLTLANPAGQVLLQDFDLHVRRGERLLIGGDPAVAIALFKAVAGLWPWGQGTINLPDGQEVMFVPQHPFLPEGSLHAALAYPHEADRYSTASMYRALECAGVAWLAPRLEEIDDWARVLPRRAQQRLGMARLFLQEPAWVFIEEATDAFDAKAEACMMETLHHELPSSTLLTISVHHGLERYYDRKLVVQRARGERYLPGYPGATQEPAPEAADPATPADLSDLPAYLDNAAAPARPTAQSGPERAA